MYVSSITLISSLCPEVSSSSSLSSCGPGDVGNDKAADVEGNSVLPLAPSLWTPETEEAPGTRLAISSSRLVLRHLALRFLNQTYRRRKLKQ